MKLVAAALKVLKVLQTYCVRRREALKQDAVSGAADDWVLARYNDPSTRSFFRRNECMVKLSDFDLWKAGCYQT